MLGESIPRSLEGSKSAEDKARAADPLLRYQINNISIKELLQISSKPVKSSLTLSDT